MASENENLEAEGGPKPNNEKQLESLNTLLTVAAGAVVIVVALVIFWDNRDTVKQVARPEHMLFGDELNELKSRPPVVPHFQPPVIPTYDFRNGSFNPKPAKPKVQIHGNGAP